ncbi:hypothetical protein PAPYR_7364 [Paratrimastix pyriformis]|uniref:Uncharacterized protein n=1 Tax=Paratrimastix pyriformis TaxID=342808 RepID=A0ABQ8UD64_9EUKA|nr:hypothetical protein PAPYR_7364 [Paratrimastix pyriformis]
MNSVAASDLSELETAYQSFRKNANEVELDLRGSRKVVDHQSAEHFTFLESLRGKLPTGDGRVTSWKEKIDQMEAMLHRLTERVQQYEAATRSGATGVRDSALGDGATSTGGSVCSATDPGYIPDSAKLAAGRNLVSRSEQSLQNSLRMIDEASRIGDQAADQLEHQTGQMERIA